jgi:hypothetical protein
MNILALDLGTTTGWATLYGDEKLQMGSHQLATPAEIKQWRKTRQDRKCDPRPLRLYDFLWSRIKPDVIVFEDVNFSTFTLQTQMWSSLRTAVWFAARTAWTHPEPVVDCVGVSALKRFATGHGGATKTMMCSALCRKFPDRFKMHGKESVSEQVPNSYAFTQGDDAVDAAWLALWAKHNLGRLVTR